MLLFIHRHCLPRCGIRIGRASHRGATIFFACTKLNMFHIFIFVGGNAMRPCGILVWRVVYTITRVDVICGFVCCRCTLSRFCTRVDWCGDCLTGWLICRQLRHYCTGSQSARSLWIMPLKDVRINKHEDVLFKRKDQHQLNIRGVTEPRRWLPACALWVTAWAASWQGTVYTAIYMRQII